MDTPSNTVNKDGKRKCSNCKCWREPTDFIGAKGNEVKRCVKCREKDNKQKKKPEVIEKRKEFSKEKKYYQVYRDKKKAEDEEGYRKHCAEKMKEWRDKNREHVTQWRQQNINYKLKGIKGQANTKGYAWNIEDEHAKSLMSSPCFYCARNDPTRVNGIDRMDSARGYEVDNCVACCKHCNFIKKSLDALTFVERCAHIASCSGQGDSYYATAWPTSKRSTFTAYAKRAAVKGLTFELDQETFYNISKQVCFYCKRPNSYHHSNGVDRVDNEKGYTVDNCVACCAECNSMKSDISLQDFMDTCKLVAERATVLQIPNMSRCYHVIQRRVTTMNSLQQTSQ